MYSIKKIIENQTNFKDEIFSFFLKENSEAKKTLNKIVSDDKYIIKEKNKLKNKYKKINQKNYIERLFFLNSHRNTTLYAWWDESEQEAKILKYDKR